MSADKTTLVHDIRLILSDIDGTLLPFGRASVSPRTRAAFHAAHNAGIYAGPASGRGFSHIPASFDGDLDCCSTCLANNGMQAYVEGELVYQALLPSGPLKQLAELVREIPDAGMLCFVDGVPQLVVGEREGLQKSFPAYAREALPASVVPDHPVEKANVFIAGDMARTRELLEALEGRVEGFDLNLPMEGFLNLTPPGWNKAKGVEVLADAIGIGLDQVVVFGDGGNDVEMLAAVPNSVAVAGAAPSAEKAARWHIGPCEDDAVAAAIEELAAGRWPFS